MANVGGECASPQQPRLWPCFWNQEQGQRLIWQRRVWNTGECNEYARFRTAPFEKGQEQYWPTPSRQWRDRIGRATYGGPPARNPCGPDRCADDQGHRTPDEGGLAWIACNQRQPDVRL